jgi:hypothetical protein
MHDPMNVKYMATVNKNVTSVPVGTLFQAVA